MAQTRFTENRPTRTARFLIAAAIVGATGSILLASSAGATPFVAVADETQDTLVLVNGKIVTGTIISETRTTIKFKGVVSGIPFETEYEKKDIASITRATKKPDGANSTTAPSNTPAIAPASTPVVSIPDVKRDATAIAAEAALKAAGKGNAGANGGANRDIAAADDGRHGFYWIKLSGKFGRDISQTPLRQAIKDAKANKAETIIIEVDAEELKLQQVGHEQFASAEDGFASVFRAEPLTTIITDEMPREWDSMPRIVSWVKRAEGGAAFLPFACPEIYFHPDGKIGGLGGLTFLFGGEAHERVYEKQVSLRLGHAEGILRAGGYDDRLVRAMAMHEYVLTLGTENGKPKLFERMPENPGEELLTDDGDDKQGRRDGIQVLARGTGDDVLTIDSRIASLLGVSKGEVSSKDELLTELGLDRDAHEITGRSERIMKDWRTGLDNAERQVRRALDDYNSVVVEAPAGYTERTRARGRRTKLLNEIVSVMSRLSEALDDRWRGQNEIPPDAQIRTWLEQIKLQQMLDRKD